MSATVDAYVLVFAGLLLTAGALGDRYGRRLALFTGFAIFGGGSILAAWAGSAGHLIATRALMGVGGAFIMPATLSILVNVFPREERPKAIAIWAATAGLGVPLGPVIGGWLLEHYWWGSIFLINVPIIAAAIVGAFLFVPESKDPEVSRLDPVGAVLSIGGLAALLYAIIEAPNVGWLAGQTLGWGAVAAVLLGAFAVWELRRDRPMLDLRLFRNPRFSAASIAITLVFFAMFGTLFFLTQYLQFVLGYSTLETGVRVTPVVLGIGSGVGIGTRLAAKIGTKIVVAVALGIVALGLLNLSTVSDGSGYQTVLISLLILGFGMGGAMSPATDSIMGAVPEANAGVGSAVNDTTRQVGGALGVAILGSLLATSYSNAIDPVARALPPEAAHAVSDSVGVALGVAAQIGGPEGQALAAAARSAFVDAMGTTALVASGFAVAGALVALLFLPAHEQPREQVETSRAEPARPAGEVTGGCPTRRRASLAARAGRAARRPVGRSSPPRSSRSSRTAMRACRSRGSPRGQGSARRRSTGAGPARRIWSARRSSRSTRMSACLTPARSVTT
ncbi:MAG TPA: MFS transporter [Thermomicrobiales bacterium]|nr:MFS transporter [Thermomicrobiales bacterium]